MNAPSAPPPRGSGAAGRGAAGDQSGPPYSGSYPVGPGVSSGAPPPYRGTAGSAAHQYSGPPPYPGVAPAPPPYPRVQPAPPPYPGVSRPDAPFPGGPAAAPQPPPGYATNGQPLASAGERLLARIIDGLLLFVPSILIVAALIGAVVGIGTVLAGSPGEPVSDSAGVIWFLLVVVGLVALIGLTAALSYWYIAIYQQRHGGQTLGKRWRKIRVVAVDGGDFTRDAARRRWLANEGVALLGIIPVLGSFTGIYNLVNALWLLWDKPNRQCLHDKYASTVVVNVIGSTDPIPGVSA